ncbi:MAG: hypothetical protein ACYC7D_14750 [Nitrososphaerales archaeon]
MPHHAKHYIPKSLKYPIFFLGLLVIIVGGLGAQQLKLPLEASIATASVGFILLLISIVVP